MSDPSPPAHAGRIRLGMTLGEGGMAIVYEGFDPVLHRRVAVKCLHPDLAENEEARRRFEEETRVLAGLDHPGALPLFDSGTLEDGRPFYAMKEVRGRTLRSLLDTRTPEEVGNRSELAHLLYLFERVCQTVAAAHERGVLHRDLKPENVMIDDEGSVFVVDWGLAKRLDRDEDEAPGGTVFGQVMGTPSYMAPEIAEGRAADSGAGVDVFSLGAILYEVLTGIRAFRGKTGDEVMTQVVHGTPRDARKLNRRASRSLAAICSKALSKDPYRRYPTARELAEDLRRHREHRAVTAVRPSLPERLYLLSRQYPRIATAAATATILALMVVAALGFKAAVDRHLADRAHRLMVQIQEQIEGLDAEILEQKQALDRLSPGSPASRQLTAEIRENQTLRELEQDYLEWTVWAVLGFTHLAPDQEAQNLARKLVREEIQAMMSGDDPYQAAAAIEFTLRLVEKSDFLQWTQADEDWLRRHLEEAEKAKRRQYFSLPPDEGSQPSSTSSSSSDGSGT